MKYKFLAAVLFALILTGCDPAHTIEFENTTEYPAKVKLNLAPEIAYLRLKQEAITGDSIVLHIKPKDNGTLYLGIGTWEDEDIEQVAQSLENIEIETADIKTIYKSQSIIRTMFKDHAEGLWWKTRIEIEIK